MAEVKSKLASDLDRDETAVLMGWCDCQAEDLWSGMKLQDILNVYHVSAEWMTWESWAQDEGDVARVAWNNVVSDPEHHMILRDAASNTIESWLARSSTKQL
jgi:hypothetical protein